MTRPGFLHGTGFALVAALAGGLAFVVMLPALAGGVALKAVAAAAGLAYLLWLLATTRPRAGRVSAVAAWATLTALAWWFAPSLALFLLAQAGFLWLLRALLCHSGPLAAGLDLALTALALAAAAWALRQTGSVGAALWCFFLLQALCLAIPARFPARDTRDADAPPDRFHQAHRVAEAALRELTARH
ncbi:MAG TPA: hypothetical protein VIX81_13515 [Gammaproteobacteria bacterium]